MYDSFLLPLPAGGLSMVIVYAPDWKRSVTLSHSAASAGRPAGQLLLIPQKKRAAGGFHRPRARCLETERVGQWGEKFLPGGGGGGGFPFVLLGGLGGGGVWGLGRFRKR